MKLTVDIVRLKSVVDPGIGETVGCEAICMGLRLPLRHNRFCVFANKTDVNSAQGCVVVVVMMKGVVHLLSEFTIHHRVYTKFGAFQLYT